MPLPFASDFCYQNFPAWQETLFDCVPHKSGDIHLTTPEVDLILRI